MGSAIGRRHAMMLGAGAVGMTFALGTVTSGRGGKGDAKLRWAVDYGAATDPVLARQYELLVLEPHHQRPIAPLRGEGATLLGYVSLGEVEKRRPYFGALDRAGPLGPGRLSGGQVGATIRAIQSILADRRSCC